MTQERLTELQRERNVLKENLDTLKEELFNKKKERGVWDIEQEQHESKMQSLEQEKAMLLEAVDSIK
jgi:predicted  nucleic acid-binding Zn-ribbon protein